MTSFYDDLISFSQPNPDRPAVTRPSLTGVSSRLHRGSGLLLNIDPRWTTAPVCVCVWFMGGAASDDTLNCVCVRPTLALFILSVVFRSSGCLWEELYHHNTINRLLVISVAGSRSDSGASVLIM